MTRDILWDIHPYIGVADLTFGMRQATVAEFLGPAVAVTFAKDIPFLEPEDYEGLYTHEEGRAFSGAEYMKTMPTVAYLDDRAVSFTFFDVHETLNVGGIFLFKGVPGQNILRLKEVSQCVIRSDEGSCFFMDFGINVLDEDLFDFSDGVTVFSKGQYDRFILAGLRRGSCQYLKGDSNALEKYL